jgi:hypothetical protein
LKATESRVGTKRRRAEPTVIPDQERSIAALAPIRSERYSFGT